MSVGKMKLVFGDLLRSWTRQNKRWQWRLGSKGGKARETALEISAVDLNKDDGMESLLAKLDAVFLREEKDRAYEAYSHFDSITKGSALSMADYIIDFEQRYNRMKKYNMTLPDAVLAFKLLDTECLEEKSRQLALTACTELTFASMKSALKRIFGGKTACGTNAIEEIQDGAFFTEQRPNVKFKRSNGSSQSGYQRQQQGTNPLDKYGKRTRCAVCQSTYHWAKDCPHRRNDVKLMED
uniref:CCHC-type domain-containing protein n=1 Tax=Knipowitschia caucasica TaxID=637954 RepID=A0AAV2MI21_KNICA